MAKKPKRGGTFNWLSADDVARRWGVNRATIYRWVKKKKLEPPSEPVEGVRRWLEDYIIRIELSGRIPPRSVRGARRGGWT